MKNLTILNTQIRTLDNLYSLNDLHRASGSSDKHRPTLFMRNQQTKELIAEINSQRSNSISGQLPSIPASKSIRGGCDTTIRGYWVCQELVIAYAAWISAAFHLKVIRAFMAINGINTQPQQIALPEPEPMIQVPMTEKELNQLINVWFLFTRFAESVQHFLNKVRDLLNINLYQHADNDLHRCNKAIQDTKPLIKRLIQLHQKHKNKSTARLHYHGDF
ncbi:KilA-N domain-containing protein [Avibacterium paragallinarum]|uniref:KilA-N domain-containing protein n=1 Tax=Avibacterium paragallinarum TaxID=728 RepID=UPI00102A7C70|nr:KilA-N domain-containing protein [Avibacterium paragallinarum]RZN75227.1 KilA-N domain-containing protein [Avibacterium paragallinarum]